MKKIKNVITLIAFTLFLTAFTTDSTSTEIGFQYDPSGIWNYESETPQGVNQTGEMTIEKEGGKYEVSIETKAYGTLVLDKVKYTNKTLVAVLELEGNSLDFEMEFDGDKMEGTIYVGELELDFTATRKK